MTTHEEYIALVEKRYGPLKKNSYEDYANYGWLKDAPGAYLVEEEMLEFMKTHPNATSRECCFYFHEVTPDGLAPGDDGADLLDD